MPLPKEIIRKLVSGDLQNRSVKNDSDYLSKLPTLGENIFPDKTTLGQLSRGRQVRDILQESGLSKGQRAGMSHILGNMERMGENDITVGDVRALTLDELMKIRSEFKYSIPTESSVEKVKKLLG